MKKLIFGFLVVLLLFLNVFAKDNSKDTKNKWQEMLRLNETDSGSSSKITKKNKDKIFIVSYQPQGRLRRINEANEITITFSVPVKSLSKVKKNEPSLISTYPQIKGEGYWKSSTTYTFVIKDKLKKSTKYGVYFKGFKGIDNISVPTKEWAFFTPVIKIERTRPYNNSKWIRRRPKILIQFSEPVDINDIKPYIKIRSLNSFLDSYYDFDIAYCSEKQRSKISYWHKNKDKRQFIVLIPSSPFNVGADIEVVFNPGLKSLEGNLGLRSKRILKFKTYGKFTLIYAQKKFKPTNGINIKFSNSVNIKSLLEKLVITPAVKINKNRDWDSRNFNIYGEFKPSIKYSIKLPANIIDIFGNSLGKDIIFETISDDYIPQFYSPMGKHFVLENYLNKEIPVFVKNIFSTDVYYKKLTEIEMTEILKADYNNIKIDESKCNKFVWKIPIKKNIGANLPFKLSKIGITEPGFYYIKFSEDNNYSNEGGIFQLTDTAIIAKFSPTQIFLSTFAMDTGEIGKNVQFNITDFTDTSIKSKDGIAIYNASKMDYLNKNIFNAKVFLENKTGYVWGKKSEMFDLWNYNFDYHYSPKPFYNHLLLFTDKNLYKAGQEVRFKGILRQIIAGKMVIPEIKSVSGTVYNSRSEKLRKFNIENFSLFGSFAHKFKLPNETPSGYYRIRLEVKTDTGNFNKTLSFSVQEYKPAKFEVKTRFNIKSIVAGENVIGSVKAKYLFGTPMKGSTGRLTMRLKNMYFTPNGWDDYSFGISDSEMNKTILSQDFNLDNSGVYSFRRDALQFKSKNSARLFAYSEIKDKDNNWISSETSMIVHRGKYYIGLKTNSYFFEQGKEGKFIFITVDENGKKIENKNINISIKKIDWKYYQKKDASGALRWNWEKIEKNILNDDITVKNGKISKGYSFKETGYYEIVLTGKDSLGNTITTMGNFYVTGDGYVSWKLDEGRIIDLVTDKKSYKKGETIKLLIKSPFKNSSALITVEREKVIWSKATRLEGNTNTIEIPVLKDFSPNIFINVLILKERKGIEWDEKGRDIGKPEFYSGYKKIAIDTTDKKLKIEIKKDKNYYGPGDEVKIKLRVIDKEGRGTKTDVCLSIVDKGVLNLTGYKLPDPFKFFYSLRPLDVKTVSTLNDVLERRKFSEKGENPGGDGGAANFGSIVARKNFKESAYYSAFITTDEDGYAEISFKLPDNLTTFKAMAVFADKTRFGYGDSDILVKKELILKPALPNFLRINDEFKGGITVTNNSPEKLSVKVKVECKNIKLNEKNIKEVKLDIAETKAVLFKFKKEADFSKVNLVFKAVGNGFSDGMECNIPIRKSKYVEATANFGKVEEKPINEEVIIPDNTFRNQDKLEVSLSSSSIIGVKKNFDKLREYPYSCLEQKISRTSPLLKYSFLKKYGLSKLDKEKSDKEIRTLLKNFGKYQVYNGGFKYYPDSIFVSSYLSCYATEFYINAKKEGYKIDKNILFKAEKYLKKICNNSINSYYPYSKNIRLMLQSYALFVLSKENIFLKDVANNLYEERDRIPLEGITYLIRALDRIKSLPRYMPAKLTRILLNKMKDEPTETHFENFEDSSWWTVHGSSVKTTAIVLDTLLDVYGKFPYAEKIARWLSSVQRQRRYFSTQDNINILKSFEKYHSVYENETPNFIARVILNGVNKIQKEFMKHDSKGSMSVILLDRYRENTKLKVNIQKDGRGILYYLLRLKYYPKGKIESIDRGFSVKKRFFDEKGEPVNEFKAGKKYIIELEIKTNKERSFVMLSDPIPSGFKVVNPSFKTSSSLSKEKISRGSKYYSYWGVFYRNEYYFDRLEIFADFLRTGTHKWQYMVMATNSGSFGISPTLVNEMYNPEVFGRNDSKKIIIK